MRSFFTVATALCIAIAVTLPISAATVATVDRTSIDETESITLVIATHQSSVATPDIAPMLDRDFSVSNSRHSMSFTMSNGQMRGESRWSWQLRPKRTGSLVIPSIQIGGESTRAITVIVSALAGEIRQQLTDAVFFETEVSSDAAYVQVPVHITRRVLYSVNSRLVSELGDPPTIENGAVITTDDRRTGVVERNGAQYGFVEQQFAVFAERRGQLVVPAASVSAYVRLPNRGRNLVPTVSSGDTVLTISPIPDAYPTDVSWFPARSVEVSQVMSPSDATEVDLGEPIQRVIEIKALDSYGAAIPPLVLDTPDAIGLYADPPQIETEAEPGVVRGRRVETITYIPKKAGTWSIPELDVVWWNTDTDQTEVISIEGRTIQVTDPDGAATVASPDTGAGTALAETAAEANSSLPQPTPRAYDWLWIASASAGWIVALAFLIAWLWHRFATSSDKKSINTIRLRAQMGSSDPRIVKSAFIQWIAQHCELSIQESTKLADSDDQGHELLAELNGALYGSDQSRDAKRDVGRIVAIGNRIVEEYHQARAEEQSWTRNMGELGPLSST